ncbi:hypothetical protein INT47_000034 [Mucor saturninus]|uniref:ATPase AAA-type core domain-containing protein n=1 Tax=Mucor saturninus TaxID=64648 RepID=A0A8H7RI24_9FUNG|nr:hypothetical protein INT47_000034 [Mucor saturninus]
METKPKRSITDHFAIVPKEKKKEVKIHPLFTKKLTKKPVSPPPPPTPPTLPVAPAAPTLAAAQPTRTKKSTEKLRRAKKIKTNKQLDILNATVDTRGFFRSIKQARENRHSYSLEPLCEPPPLFDNQAIQDLMNLNYPQWQSNACCKLLFDSINFRPNLKIPWCDKYRPNCVDGLVVADLPDLQYLRDWLETLKIRKDPDRKNVGSLQGEDEPFNLVLLVGCHGIGKTAAVYTAAKETGYSIFEINASSRRTGKDVIKQVGEMTASHLVRFDHQQKKRKTGETIIIRDTVKKSKKVDIASHFKRMLTMSSANIPPEKEADVVMEDATSISGMSEKVAVEEDTVMEEAKPIINHTITSFFKKAIQTPPPPPSPPAAVVEEDISLVQVKPVNNTITSFFKKSMQKTATTESSISTTEPIMTITESTTTTTECQTATTESSTTAAKVSAESLTETEAESMDEEANTKDEHKQSLVLLEEVDILFEEDKGFWPAVIELCQKSRRPIIMTCNDDSEIPFEQLNIQTTIYFEIPEKQSMLAYVQLICCSENKTVEPYDLEFLCELYHYDIRKVIQTLQLWLNDDNRYLFARVMGFLDLLWIQKNDTLGILMDRLKGSSAKTIELCIDYITSKQGQHRQEKVMGIEDIHKRMENAAYADAWIEFTDKQRHQIYAYSANKIR